MEKYKRSKIRSACDIGGVVALTALEYSSIVVNEAIQQVKHGYYHLKNIKHERVERGEMNSDAFFDTLGMYIKVNL